jgi:hypothetical protein
MRVLQVVVADGETNVSVDTIPPDAVAPPAVTSLEIVATTQPVVSKLGNSDSSTKDVVAIGLIGGAVVLSAAWWALAVKGRVKPM